MYISVPIPVATRSKAWVWANSLAGILGSNPPGAWIFVSREYCVLSGGGLCLGLVTSPEESYWVWCASLSVITKPHKGRPLHGMGSKSQRRNKTPVLLIASVWKCGLHLLPHRLDTVVFQRCIWSLCSYLAAQLIMKLWKAVPAHFD